MFPHSPSCKHFVHFYRDDASVRDAVAGYVAAALRAGDPALVIARPALQEQLRIELHRQHVQGTPFGADRGALAALDAAETLARISVRGRPHAGRFRAVLGGALARLGAGHRHVAVYGDMVGLLCEQGRYPDALELERLWNQLLAGSRASLYCGYPLRLFEQPEARACYEEVRAAHTAFRDDGLTLAA